MDRLETLRAFVAVAEEASFTRAARRLSMSAPAVTRAIAALEKRVGSRLLHRTTRVVRLTDAGARFFADCKRILIELEKAEGSAAGSHAEPRGRLSLTASVMFGHLYVSPLIIDFLALYPQVTVRSVFSDRVVDLLEEGMDVAVRIAHLADSSFTATKVGTVRRVVCASPAYLEAHGAPRIPADLNGHDTIVFSQDASAGEWGFHVSGTLERVRLNPRLIVNAADLALAAAVAGRGLTRVLSYQAADDLRAGRLQIVLAEYEPPPIPVNVVCPEGRRAAAKVRAFVDFAVDRLRARLK